MQQTYRNGKNTLYIVSTPIGNLEDITYRAINILNEVGVVFAEDTRKSQILFNHYNINTQMYSYFEHNKLRKIDDIIEHLNKGVDVALISDAGTPGISDPGFELINKVIDEGYNVTSVPGATASMASLTSSGLVMQPHMFIGFLPRKRNQIIESLTKYKTLDATLIFYESPYRVKTTLELLYEVFGDRKVTLARELTKIYETFIRTTLKKAVEMDHINKGEYVILVEGAKDLVVDATIEELYEKYKKTNMNEKDILRQIAKDLNISRRDVYQELKTNN